MDHGNQDGWRRRDRNRTVGLVPATDIWRRRNGDRPSYSAVHDPTNRFLPWWISQIGDDVIQEDQPAEFTTGGSCLVVDSRDRRLVSPLQGLFPIEIHDNALSSVNIMIERSQLTQRINGYELSLFAMYTVCHFKLVVFLSMDSSQSVPVAAWDSPTGEALNHPAFAPFTWPQMHSDTPTLVDFKLRYLGEILLHFEFVANRSDADMTVTRFQVNPNALRLIQDDSHEFSVQCFAFSGFKVSAVSFELGGRLYTCSAGGQIVASDFPRIHFEVRKTLRNCADALGSDADKVDFRYRDGREFLFECRKMQVPSSWIVACHISGQACPRICQLVRESGGRVESPDQGMQLGQLSTIHERWFRHSIAEEGENRVRGDLVRTNIRVDSSEANTHFIVDAQLRVHQAEVVHRDALALSDHDPGTAQMALFLPPRGGEGVRVIAAGPGERTLPVPVENLVYQPPAATARVHVVALADEGAQPRQGDGRHYVQLPIERPSLEVKRIRAAEAEAKQRARRFRFAPECKEIDIQEILLFHAPIQAPPTLEEAAFSIKDLSADQDALVELHLEKFKAVRDLETALQRRVQLHQVAAQSHLPHKSDEESRRLLARATDLCQMYTATIDASRARINELESAILPLAEQIELINEIPEVGARSDSLEHAQIIVTMAASLADRPSTAGPSSQVPDAS